MEMGSSRRSFDRTRDPITRPGLKKPRLNDEPVSIRNIRGGQNQSKFNSESSDTERPASPYQPQPAPQHHELVSQYRTALAELTFNSKPIITNLTIIAGENLMAAKAIASTVCANILEVPSEQKLPSLYLLDSIVKNIGRDYIKHFAAKLPEVFCKAYKQVDPAIHPGMRHLFGTWKGVFPPQTLQMIEKELGFQPVVNGSSSGTAISRPDSQPQRPARSIHVNPKYLEARQRLQQTSKVKEVTSDITTDLVNLPEDNERPQRTVNINSGRTRTDPRLRIHNIQHSQLSNSLKENNIDAAYGEIEYGPDTLRQSDVDLVKASESATDRGNGKPWYAAGNNTEKLLSQKKVADAKYGLTSYQASRAANAGAKQQPMHKIDGRNSNGMSGNWKNSEEEEYMWDDMSTRSASSGVPSSLRKDPRMANESQNLDFENHLQKPHLEDLGSVENSPDSHSMELRDQAASGRRMSPTWLQEPRKTDMISHSGSDRNVSGYMGGHSTSFSGLSTNYNSLARSFLPSNALPMQQPHTLSAPLPSGQSTIHRHPPSPSFPPYQPSKLSVNLVEKEHPPSQILPRVDLKSNRLQGQLNMGIHSQSPQDSIQTLPQNIQGSISAVPSFQPKNRASFSLQPELPESEPSVQSQKLLDVNPVTDVNSSVGHSKPVVSDLPGHSTTSSLLAAVMNSGILGNKSVSLPEATVQPPLPSGPPPNQFSFSIPRVTSSPSSTLPNDRPPLPPGPPPAHVDGVSTQVSKSGKSAPNPMSSLLNSLVSKGLISASKADSTTSLAPSNSSIGTNEIAVPLPVISSALLPPSTSDEFSVSRPAAKSSVPASQSTEGDLKSIIGFEFKPDIIRVSHPSVISELIDDLPHRCSICGLRFKLQDRFEKHNEWHKLKHREPSSSNQISRRWFANSVDWISGKAVLQSNCETNEPDKTLEMGADPMVYADESQCVCILCGELFEDFYSQEKEEWMFKGAVYLTNTESGNTSGVAAHGPIVHAQCVSASSFPDLGLATDVKVENSV